jgi:hypothetical protein
MLGHGLAIILDTASDQLEPLALTFDVLVEIASLGRCEIGLSQYAGELLHWGVASHPQVPKDTGGTADCIAYTALD